jgi:hypothetical protein
MDLNSKKIIIIPESNTNKVVKTEKEKVKRVISTTSKWNVREPDLYSEKQIAYIDDIYQKNKLLRLPTGTTELSRSPSPSCALLRIPARSKETGADTETENEIHHLICHQIQQKIHGYHSQDVHKHILDPELFVCVNDVVELLFLCKLDCFYCKEKVQVLYDIVREPKQWTLERIDNDFGHNRGNVSIACLKCNLGRRTMYQDRYSFTKQMGKICKLDQHL